MNLVTKVLLATGGVLLAGAAVAAYVLDDESGNEELGETIADAAEEVAETVADAAEAAQ